MPTVAELMNALPETEEAERVEPDGAGGLLGEMSMRPVPVGRLRRLRLLGTLQAKIAAAYLFYWIRGWFKNAAGKERLLAETHWRTALRLLDSMSYLRGAVMKVGQTLANFPDIAPGPFVETLERLHFDAPPMHWSLLREMVHNELGDDPEYVFASFEKQAFAAASLGQYPGIARTIREDFRNLFMFLLPQRLSKDWENVKDQFHDLSTRLEQETDYEAEAAAQTNARPLFREDDGIVVPRLFPQHSTARLLTMERLDGVHLDEYLARNPSQEDRNEFARKILRSWYRMMFVGRTLYADCHPGNFLFMDDGRLGVIDFGFMLPLTDELWHAMRHMDRALTTGSTDDRIAAMKEWCDITDAPADADRLRLTDEWADWCWRSRYCGGEFDFGDEADFRRGVDLFAKMVARRYSRAKPCTPIMARQQFGWRSILYRLRAKIDIRAIAEEEVKATGWDRSEYA